MEDFIFTPGSKLGGYLSINKKQSVSSIPTLPILTNRNGQKQSPSLESAQTASLIVRPGRNREMLEGKLMLKEGSIKT